MKLRTENPLLRYQLFGFTVNRWKRQPWLYGAVAVGVGLTYLLVFQLVAFNQSSFSAALNLCLFIMCLTAPLMAYNLFSLEYEKQTWESLALTRLTAKEILWGKWGAALARVGILTLLALPMLLTTANLDIYVSGSLRGKYPTVLEPTTNLYPFTAGVFVLFSWGALIVSLGMWLSFRLKRTLSTASTLYAGQVFALALLPMLYLTFSIWETGSEFISAIGSYWEGFAWWLYSLFTARAILYLNPFWTAAELQRLFLQHHSNWWLPSWEDQAYEEGLLYLNWGFAQGFTYLALALLFAGLTYRGLKYAWRK
ncbi:MAG: hypothetical protein N2554_02165 [Fimbriimonadales bacterium]|nr:hypothetical protein [Fimbriimonadales bacterium]